MLFAQEHGIAKEKKLSESEVKQLEKAELFMSEKNYKLALPIFERLLLNHPEDIKLKYSTAVCGLSYPGKQKISLDYLEEVYGKNKKAYQIEFMLAKAYYYNNRFEESLKMANLFALKNKKAGVALKKEISNLIASCTLAKKYSDSPVNVTIKNLGSSINTSGAESSPNIREDGAHIFFTYRGEKSVGGLQNPFNQPDKNGLYFEDAYEASMVNGAWQTPVALQNINTKNNDAVLCLSYDEKELFISVDSPKDDGDIYSSKYDNGVWQVAVALKGSVNTKHWEDNCSISADGKFLFFSSNRPGGLGGKDIYQASLMPDGTWGNIKNLGDKINTSLDDDAPFIHCDGRLFIFSSKGHNSMGGYDVFKSYLNPKDSTWSVPENMGFPINTGNDETHYMLSSDGEIGYYSIGLPDGNGDLDIYSVEPGIIGIMPTVVVVKGKVTLDTTVAKAEIVVEVPSKNKVVRNLTSNETTGNFSMVLPVGEDYKITWKLNKLEPKSEMIMAQNVNEYLLKKTDIRFTTPKDTSLTSQLKANVNNVMDSVIDGLVYRIQVSTKSMDRKLKRKLKKEFSPVKKDIVDNEAKYTLKEEYNTLRKAQEMVEKVRVLVPDAFILGFSKGQRYHLHELREKGILLLKSQK